jgi:hypothetical protein
MPNPTQADLHINAPLTNVSVAYMMKSDMFMSTKVFPRVPVQKQSDLYWKYSKSDWRRTDVQKRAPGTESAGIGWKVDTGQYFAHVYAVHKDVDDQVRSNADSYWQLDKDSTLFVTNQLMLKRDIDWNAAFFTTGIWGTEQTGASQFDPWDDVASDPIVQFANLQTDFIKNAGMKANVLVLGASAITALKNHPDIIDRIKYTQRGVVSEDLLASLLDVERILVSYASKTDVLEQDDARTQDAAATYGFISDPNSALLCYSPNAPSLMTPAAGYTFTWNGYVGGNQYGIRMKNFRMEHIASDRIEGEMTYDMRVISPDMGVFLTHVANN